MRKTVAMVAAVVVAVLAVVSADGLTSPVAWATAAVLVVVTAAAVATVNLTPTPQRVVIGLGALLAVVGIAVAIGELAVRGYRTASSAPLLGLVVGIAGLLIVIGVAAARSAPSPTALWSGAAALAVIALAAGVVVGTTVPYLPLSRSISYTSADTATTLTLDAPGGAVAGDMLVAQVFRSGAGEVRPPQGWTTLRTTPLPGGTGSVTLFTTRATDATGPSTFTTDTPATLLGGVGAWSHVATATAPGEATGNGGAVTASPGPDEKGIQVLYFVAGTGVADLTTPDPLSSAWVVKADNVVKATTALVTRPALSADPAAPVSLTPSAPLTPWAVQTVVLQAD
ncbi:hypothetical protein LQ327_02335 [Actinomycetospora endophytica]|uniref:Uncharacterized protein n=1 Tax=Actinomycetospora endophytica TaxID=2291215 RepID=A0ABS8P1V8_9PSEU|nr:hypothetical protein [Actinomycetospora endophytica]MCD2192233.1 hypothetical protein [Actinomycetospora endophytica]